MSKYAHNYYTIFKKNDNEICQEDANKMIALTISPFSIFLAKLMYLQNKVYHQNQNMKLIASPPFCQKDPKENKVKRKNMLIIVQKHEKKKKKTKMKDNRN